ncbi:MAG: electron transport complex subunit RsxC [Betaproteobacteria bacterium]|nr:electron transport complex subunit RsxC [Betaproteobacteria bacterium]
MMLQLFKFKGGVKPESHKQESANLPIRSAPLPTRVIIPLRLNSLTTATPTVAIGDAVSKGQCIATAEGRMSTGIHASTSGHVVAIEDAAFPHPSGFSARSVIIAPDGEDRWCELMPFDETNPDPQALREFLRNAGIVGLGGAGFPSHVKLSPGQARVDTLIINGAECEPWITCDDRLMRERATAIIAGARIMRRAVGAQRIIVGIEDNKPEAVAAMQAAAAAEEATGGEAAIRVVAVPTRYPAGGEKQLIRVLTGIEIPFGKLGFHYGVQCFNVGTAYAVHRAVAFGEPLVNRVVTLTGNVETAGNWEIPIGMPIDEFIALGKPKADTDRFLMGGPMMGFSLPGTDAPLIKTSNCIIAGSPKLFPPPAPEMPCIRCGECAKACPIELQPFELYWHTRAKTFGKTQEYHIFDCIECGCCSFVCPSRIPLVQYFRFAKSEIWAREKEKNAADQAKARFEWKTARDEREKAEKAEKLAKAAAAQAAKKAAEAAAAAAAPVDGTTSATPPPAAAEAAAPVDADAARKAAIAAAMERARAQREAATPKNTDQLTPAQQREIAAVDALRQQAGIEPVPATPATEEPKS